jgi:branched-chain amino acid transport system permease protein
LFGWVLVRSAGVYLAMLSLSLAQWVWAIASQWDAVTGGDNGRIGLQLIPNTARSGFLWGLLLLACAALVGLRRLVQSPLGAALQALRDAPVRAQASGLSRLPLRYGVLVGSASLAGLAGGLFAAHKGAVFPAVASVATSVDVLLVILLGGPQHLWGSVAGASVLLLANSELGRDFDYWRGALGVLVMVIMVLAPAGLLGWRKGFEKGRGHGT